MRINFLIVLAVENDALKVVQFNRPSTNLIAQIVKPKLSTEYKDYEEQVAGIEVIEYAENGLIVNAEKEILTDGVELVTIENNDNISLLSDFPVLSHYSTYHYPSKISVKMNYSGNGEIVDVPFTDYMKNTLPNEWYGSWNSEALKAGV